MVVFGGEMERCISIGIDGVDVDLALFYKDLNDIKMAGTSGVMKWGPFAIVLAVKHVLLVNVLFNIGNHFL